jgi:hypothetical protein
MKVKLRGEVEMSGGKQKRGSTNNKKRLDAFSSSKPGRGADWGGCESELIQQVVTEITALGGACTFGLSRDMGAHSLTLLLDGDRETLWFNGNADLNQELTNVVGMLKAMA